MRWAASADSAAKIVTDCQNCGHNFTIFRDGPLVRYMLVSGSATTTGFVCLARGNDVYVREPLPATRTSPRFRCSYRPGDDSSCVSADGVCPAPGDAGQGPG